MKNYKKVLAAALAMAMVAGNSVLAAAPGKSYVTPNDFEATTSSDATGSITGGGQMEGNVSKDVFKVVVPSSIQGANAASFTGFNFVMDPQKLITATEAEKYTDATGGSSLADGFVPDKTLYFVNKTDRQLDNTSDYVMVTNKSSMKVEVSLSAKMDQLGSITMSDTDEFAEDDDSASLYLAILGGNDEKAIDDTAAGVEVKGTIAEAKDGAYKIVYDGTVAGDYSYDLVNDDPALFSSYEFALTGATNEYGDWSNVTDTPEVQFTWKVEPATSAAPSIATKTYTMTTGTPVVVTVDLGTGDYAATGIASITYKTSADGAETKLAADRYSFADGKLTISKDYVTTLCGLANFTSRDFKVIFNDTAKTEVTITLKK